MGAWHATYADLLRTRFGALVAYADLLVDDPAAARDLAQDATVAVFSRRRTPRSLGAAELAAREWMNTRAIADGASPEHVARVTAAINGELPPEESADLRRRFSETAGVYAVPSGGVNAVMEPARRGHRSAMIRATALGAGALVLVGGAAYAAPKYLPSVSAGPGATTASASPSPSATLLTITWDPEPDYNAAVAGFHFPKCGEEFAPAPQAVGGITPKASGQVSTDPSYGTFVSLDFMVTTAEEGAHWVLADSNTYVVTRDDVVIFAPEFEFNGLDLYLANGPAPGGAGFDRSGMCDAQAAAQKYQETIGDLDFEKSSQDEIDAYIAKWEEFRTQWKTWEPGIYKIYAVTPLVFGEQAALGQVFFDDGVTNTSALTWDISWTPLAQDERVLPYCAGSMEVGDFHCYVPDDVLKEVLTREVDPATVVDIAPGMGISEPIVFDWTQGS